MQTVLEANPFSTPTRQLAIDRARWEKLGVEGERSPGTP